MPCCLTGIYERSIDDPRGAKKSAKTWCGRTSSSGEWVFQDASHAALSGLTSAIMLCTLCSGQICKALRTIEEKPADTLHPDDICVRCSRKATRFEPDQAPNEPFAVCEEYPNCAGLIA